MYNIAPQFIRDYVLQNFSSIGRLSADDKEFVMESLFEEGDWKRHMSVNIDSGLWQCFKTGRKGNFTSLYAEAEGVPYFRAQRDLIIKNFEFLGEEVPELPRSDNKLELDTSKLIPINIHSGDSEDESVLNAWNFLFGRRLFNEVEEEEAPFYLCNEGKFAGRVIIPYKSGETVFFFQARALYGQQPKYLNPSSEIAPKSSNILYPYDEGERYLLVVESPLCARALQLLGLNATSTQGCVISDQQANILSTFQGSIILGFDNDSAGKHGVKRFEETRKRLRMYPFDICPIPEPFKDWNDAYIGGVDLKHWVFLQSVRYDFEYEANQKLNSL